MKRSLAAATGLLITMPVVAVTMPTHAADTPASPSPPRVVADKLDNPRQLNWAEDDKTLIVAEAGRGGQNCPEPPEGPPAEGAEPPGPCVGSTGSVTTITNPEAAEPTVARPVSGLPSVSAPNGAFAVGTNGAEDLPGNDEEGVFILAQSPGITDGPPAPPTADSNQGLYLAADPTTAPPPEEGEELPFELITLPGGDFAFLGVDLFEAEQRLNPDTAQIESNPYAVLFVDEDPNNDEDGFALVADAAANAVWKVAPNPDATSSADYLKVTVFATYPTTLGGEPEGAPPGAGGPPEFVPTALAMDDAGHIFVGGLGSEVKGAAQVVKYNATGKEIRRWTGFTGITGLAVDKDNIYVSQLFGSNPPPGPGEGEMDGPPPAPPTSAPGSVVKTSRHSTDAPRHETLVPFPAGVAVRDGKVYVAVNSIAPADGVEDLFGPGSFDLEGGQVWEIGFTKDKPGGGGDGGGGVGGDPGGGPEDTDGKFVPIETINPGYYDPFSGTACGSNVTIAPGDVRKVEARVTVMPDGTVTTEYRGEGTVDVSRDSDGAFIDELDVSGAAFEVATAEPTEDGKVVVTVGLEGRSIVLPMNETQAAALTDAGLPAFLFFAGGTVVLQDVLQLSMNPDEMPESTMARVLSNTATGVEDVCKLLDAAPKRPAAGDLMVELNPLNNSGVTGTGSATVAGTHLDVELDVFGAAPDLPHAQHIHFGEDARHECPTFRDDKNGDRLINTVEGQPAYGPIAVSLTTSGDTSPASGLALDRMPTANAQGNYAYERDDIVASSERLARAIARGEGVVVVHGIDINSNGEYDLEALGVSELMAGVPAEATLPVACGVLNPMTEEHAH